MVTRLLMQDDLPAAAALLVNAGLAGGAANVGRYLTWQPDGVWGQFSDGALVGMVSLLRYGAVGFVGCMAVEPAAQGRGIGRALLEHAHAEGRRTGVETFLLEATESGARLYRRLGYVEEYATAVMTRAPSGPSDAAPIARAHRAEILELDRAATASARDTMVSSLLDEHHGAVAQVDGVAGYGVVVGDRLGPVIARDPGAGRDLIGRLAPACSVAGIPLANEHAVAAAAAHGFTEVRRLIRMRLGPPVPSRISWQWALASPGAG